VPRGRVDSKPTSLRASPHGAAAPFILIALASLACGGGPASIGPASPPPGPSPTLRGVLQPARVFDSPHPDPAFGDALATDGHTLAIGATTQNSGRGSPFVELVDLERWAVVGVLEIDGDDRLTPSFANSVAVQDNWLAVGQWGTDLDDGPIALFARNRPGWQLFATASGAPAPRSTEDHGRALAFGDGVLFVGHGLASPSPTAEQAGVVHRYDHTAVGWIWVEAMAAAHPAFGFGSAQATAGDWLAVGNEAPRDHAVVLFHRGGNGDWTEVATLPPPTTDERAGPISFTLAMHGDRLAIGTPELGRPGTDRVGQVALYDISSTPPTLSRVIAPPADASSGTMFGQAIALDGEHLAVGQRDPPQVTVYDARGQRVVATLQSDDARGATSFGTALAMAGRYVYVGVPGNEAADRPRVEVFTLP